MKKVKQTISIILVVMFCIGMMNFGSLAVNSVKLYSNKITVQPNTTVKIPFYISDNCGLMRFSVNINYDSSVLRAIKVERGTVLKSGMFDDSIGTGSYDNLKIVWSGTKNVTENGTLFFVEFEVLSSPKNESIIHVSYNQFDTFNENWEKVEISCEDITVVADPDVDDESEKNGTSSFFEKISAFIKKFIDMIKNFFGIVEG